MFLAFLQQSRVFFKSVSRFNSQRLENTFQGRDNNPWIFFSAPTSGPTTPNGNLLDECDDDQANCHSGTGDDFQLTGAETIFIPLLCHFSSCHCVPLSRAAN